MRRSLRKSAMMKTCRSEGGREMTLVSCGNTECIHCDMTDFHCTKSYISVGDGFDCGCNDLEPYYNQPDFCVKYYKCVKTKNGELGKCKCYGKRIEFNGRVFFTSDRITDDGSYQLTEAVTGYAVGMFKQLDQRFCKMCEIAESIPNVETLPLAEWDNDGYILVEGEDEL